MQEWAGKGLVRATHAYTHGCFVECYTQSSLHPHSTHSTHTNTHALTHTHANTPNGILVVDQSLMQLSLHLKNACQVRVCGCKLGNNLHKQRNIMMAREVQAQTLAPPHPLTHTHTERESNNKYRSVVNTITQPPPSKPGPSGPNTKAVH